MGHQTNRQHGQLGKFDVKTLDLTRLAAFDGSEFVRAGFLFDAAFFREYIAKWGFGELGDVVDIGCGYGRWTFFLAEVNSFARGVERNASRIEMGRELSKLFGFDNVDFVCGDVASAPVGDELFDGAWCFNALQFTNRGECLSRIHGMLKPRGVLFVGKYECAGKILEKFFVGYALGGTTHRITRFAIRALAQGGECGDGMPNYGDPESMERTLNRFGFELDHDFAPEVELSKKEPSASPFVEDLRDLASLGKRLESDETYASEFARYPGLANALPVSIQFRARKKGV